MPFSLHLCPAPDHPEGLDAASVMYGPYVMTAKSSRRDWITLNLSADPAQDFQVRKKGAYPRLHYEDLEFIPMCYAHDMPYHTYFRIRYR